jgi:hypothetical protein
MMEYLVLCSAKGPIWCRNEWRHYMHDLCFTTEAGLCVVRTREAGLAASNCASGVVRGSEKVLPIQN